ncbi:M23 family metallopeptidase [Mucilaginibacter defluvii]|uniref:M23 family metallopeptidase n=1 Tax=Mucilaginibacter defluvii TaxID=1196019 RepID=A0ABP9FY84_9SPHI
MTLKKLRLLVTGLFICGSAAAQNIIQNNFYPKDIFRYPLDLPPSTAGSFGELRPNHFHSGLDFKTNQRTGYPIYAILDGFVSRLRIQYGGFGRAVYITHPNGFTSVYGHLERFSPEIEALIRDYQMQRQSYEVDFQLLPLQLPLKKGEVFAWTGNAGASAGPHLHFELRDSKTEETINPQLFGLTIPDKVPPTLQAIATYHFADGAPFSEKTPHMFLAVVGANGQYRLKNNQPIHLSGETGFGLTAYDMNSVSPNHNGIYSVELKLDGNTVYTFAVERFGFDQTRAINAYLDYPAFLTSRRWMQKCFVPPGSNISLYPQSVNRGIINFDDDAMHEVQYVVRDVAGNTSTLTVNVKSSKNEIKPFVPKGPLFQYDKTNEFNNDKVKVVIEPGNLYDNLDFNYARLPRKPGTYSETHRIHNRFTPIHSSFSLWIKPDSSIGQNADKAVLINTAGNLAIGKFEDGYVKGQCRFFGDYYIKIDTVPPVITPVNIREGSNLSAVKSINLRMSDNLSGVKSYTGKIDGKWVLVEHDYKTKLLRYYFDKDIKPGKHTFELTVTDAKDNASQFKANFYR